MNNSINLCFFLIFVGKPIQMCLWHVYNFMLFIRISWGTYSSIRPIDLDLRNYSTAALGYLHFLFYLGFIDCQCYVM